MSNTNPIDSSGIESQVWRKETELAASTAGLHQPVVDINRLGAALATGAVLGATIGGAGARIAMRVVALLGDGQPGFTAGGTLAIVIIGGVLGVLGGLGFALLCGLLRMAWGEEASSQRSLGVGTVYGGVLAALTAVPFFLSREGELALASPLIGAALFAWIPLAYGLALGTAVPSVERRIATAPRTVDLGWLVSFGLALALALAAMAPLLGGFVPFPPAATSLHYSSGLSFAAAQALHRGLMLAFVLAYCGLSTWIFWRGAHNRMARLASVTLLLLAAAFFGRQPALATGMQALPLARLLPELLQAGALSLLLILLFILPDGKMALRWTRPAAVVWCAWTLLWFVNPLPGTPLDVSAWPEPVLLAALAGGLGSGLAVMGWRVRSGAPAQQRMVRPALLGFAVALGSFALLALCALAMPELRLRVLPLPRAVLAFAPYLLPWLLLPLSLVLAMRRGLWSITSNA